MTLHFHTQQLGIKAETSACVFLKKQGFKLVKRNFFTPFGELDLIMQNAKFLIFVEVRYRKLFSYGNAIESIDSSKQSKIIRSATFYLQKYPTWKACRFDVVAIQATQLGEQINWIKDAFQVQ